MSFRRRTILLCNVPEYFDPVEPLHGVEVCSVDNLFVFRIEGHIGEHHRRPCHVAQHVKEGRIFRIGRGACGVHRKAGMLPGGHRRDEAGRDALFFQELGQEILAEEIFYELGIEIQYVMKLALAIEEALTYDPMNIGIPLQKIARGVDGKDGTTRRARYAVPGQGLLHGPLDRLKDRSRIQLQKQPIAKQNPSDCLGDGEDPKAMRHR